MSEGVSAVAISTPASRSPCPRPSACDDGRRPRTRLRTADEACLVLLASHGPRRLGASAPALGPATRRPRARRERPRTRPAEARCDRHRWGGPSRRSEVLNVTGLRVVDPVTAWMQSAPWLTEDEIVSVADALAGRWSPYADARELPVSALVTAVEHSERARGTWALRRALPLVRPDVESPKETELRLLLGRAGLPEPEVNVRTYDENDLYLGKPDLRWLLFNTCAEYEGDEHRTDKHRTGATSPPRTLRRRRLANGPRDRGRSPRGREQAPIARFRRLLGV